MSDTRPVGSVVFGPESAPKRAKKPAEIPVVESAVKSAAASEIDGEFPDFGAILASASSGERPTETRTFTIKGKPYKFEIYVDGRDDAEVWSELCAAMQYGYSQKMGAELVGQVWEGVKETFPIGDSVKSIVVKNPDYIGAVRVLQRVLKRPLWTLDECLMMGHVLGKGFMDVCEWAAEVNGVTEKIYEQLRAIEKNALNRSRQDS